MNPEAVTLVRALRVAAQRRGLFLATRVAEHQRDAAWKAEEKALHVAVTEAENALLARLQ